MSTTKYINVVNQDLDLGALTVDDSAGAGGGWVLQFTGSGTWTMHDEFDCPDQDPTTIPTAAPSAPTPTPSPAPLIQETPNPSVNPSSSPVSIPTPIPTPQPTSVPTSSLAPVISPSSSPTTNSNRDPCSVKWIGDGNVTTFASSLTLLSEIPDEHDTLAGAMPLNYVLWQIKYYDVFLLFFFLLNVCLSEYHVQCLLTRRCRRPSTSTL